MVQTEKTVWSLLLEVSHLQNLTEIAKDCKLHLRKALGKLGNRRIILQNGRAKIFQLLKQSNSQMGFTAGRHKSLLMSQINQFHFRKPPK